MRYIRAAIELRAGDGNIGLREPSRERGRTEVDNHMAPVEMTMLHIFCALADFLANDLVHAFRNRLPMINYQSVPRE